MSGYAEFIDSKRLDPRPVGFEPSETHAELYDFQEAVTRWACRRGRSAVFGDCGLGKTFIQLEWARMVAAETAKPVLIFTPLAVADQTVKEAARFGIAAVHVQNGGEVEDATIAVANYERLHLFEPSMFSGIVLDESSILKNFAGHYRQRLTEFASSINYRLCCTATPAPNDRIELINHAEFLGIMDGKTVLSMFFVQDGNTTHKWRLKRHAEEPFWKWLATWAVAFRSPEDLGFDGSAFVLPALNRHEHIVSSPNPTDTLFPVEAKTLHERRGARRRSLEERAQLAANLVASQPDEQWLLWCNLNDESSRLGELIPGAVEVRGSDSSEHKARSLLGFSDGSVRVMVTKPSIAGHGMNWQTCARVAYVGLSDSYEQLYQSIRRCWRFGQTREVDMHIIISEEEGAVKKNVERKEAEASDMFERLVAHLSLYQLDKAERDEASVDFSEASGEDWTMYQGDSFYLLDRLKPNSVGLSVFSPPFPGMYAYTNSAHDLGNSKTIEELVEHLGMMMVKLLKATMPGRHCCLHLSQVPSFKWLDGHIGIKDFRGATIRMMEDVGWHYYGEVCIDKNPQVKAIRTKDRGLLFKTLATDSSHLHMALADYLLQFRKPGENAEPIKAGISEKYGSDGWITADEWIEWARPVWYAADLGIPGGIRETDVLSAKTAKDVGDEKHLCPLQLGVIERAIKLWSNPGDVVLSPFAGIGSEGVSAMMFDRRFIGMELKPSYYQQACRNVAHAARHLRQQGKLWA